MAYIVIECIVFTKNTQISNEKNMGSDTRNTCSIPFKAIGPKIQMC